MSLLLATRAIVSLPGEEWSADLDGLFIQQVPLKKSKTLGGEGSKGSGCGSLIFKDNPGESEQLV